MRLNLLPDPAWQELQPALVERLTRMGAALQPEQLGALLDPLMRDVLHAGFAEAGADEGTVWLLDSAGVCLVPAYNTGPRAAQFVGKFKQPLNSGLICMVFATEQPFLENDVPRDARQSKLLDSLLQVQTSALMAVPFHLLNSCRGVVSCVQLAKPGERAPNGRGFRSEHLASVQRAAALLSRLVEFKLLSDAVGWTST